MKLILSRKGFDSGVAPCGSPIFPDCTMLSLPIPLASAPVAYRDISWRGQSLGPVVEALSGGAITADRRAHLDPDLSASALPRLPGWRPAFGQTGASQSHLSNAGVGAGDLFLFFGWFQQTDATERTFRRYAPDEHVMFGWLQVGQILSVQTRFEEFAARFPWLAAHPHLEPGTVWNRPNNTIYLASDRLVIGGRDMGVPGGGIFGRFHPGLRLTEPGRTRRHWSLPGWLHPDRTGGMSYHANPSAWGEHGETVSLKSASQGQEFVATVPPEELARWMASLLGGCQNGAVASDLET